ncbi:MULTISPECIES: hypothetical protein [unclassified Marinobacter]|jgi:hypothetical protein|uniref:hypothetical protein n=1 Tax=unclassified Marinobacter TaxID=83889 RepID=UPI00200C3A3E|nr:MULTISPECIES: hypothetical protein [unclassified Marinobacter]MCL1480497.1 hypothetical protein [Marinobacter sp.]MCL1487814.1 hypothetical protein [Marinobacter sp.]UQG56297.1 hypothetical protein MIH16_01065 [Marinobacter sp. M4C]UQG65101.1 hypothetical protein MIH17_01065 [Marinobacter sp. M2C]UQG69380.1 hypothetical protein MIH19_01065 [Marinobacter sp. M1C]
MAKQVIGCLCLAAVLVIASLLVPATVDGSAEMDKVPHGFPFPFLWQSVEKLDPPSFPRSYAVMLPQEYPTRVSLIKLSLNVALVGAVAFAVLQIFRRWRAGSSVI